MHICGSGVGSKGWGVTGVWVSMVLTSTLHWRCTPGRNRRIPTISAGCFGGRLVNVSAVDTGRRVGSSPWCLGGEVGRVGRRRVRTLCLVFGGSGYEREGYPTNARRSLKGSSEAGGQRPAPGPDPFPPRVGPSRSAARGWGTTGRGLCVLHEPPTPWSTPDARAVAPHPRGVDTGRRAGSTSRGCGAGESLSVVAVPAAFPGRRFWLRAGGGHRGDPDSRPRFTRRLSHDAQSPVCRVHADSGGSCRPGPGS